MIERSYAAAKKRVLSAPHHFALLGCHRQSSKEELTAARNALARLFHPDRNAAPDAPAIMATINAAADALLDPQARRLYVALLKGPTCSACKGAGCRKKQKGFTDVVITACAACLGSGVERGAK